MSLSHEVMPMTRIVPRGFTACADAYLTPRIKNYLQVITSAITNERFRNDSQNTCVLLFSNSKK